MPDNFADLSQRAHELPADERVKLAEELLSSLEGEPDAQLDAAWDEELRKRIEEVESGAVELVPASEAFARVRRSLR